MVVRNWARLFGARAKIANEPLRGVRSGGSRDTTPWVRAGTGEVEPLDRRVVATDSVERPPLRELIETFVHVHRMSAARAPVLREIRGGDELARHHATADAWGNGLEHRDRAFGEGLARIVAPAALDRKSTV